MTLSLGNSLSHQTTRYLAPVATDLVNAVGDLGRTQEAESFAKLDKSRVAR